MVSAKIIALVVASTVLIGHTIARPQGGLCPNGQPWFPDANTVDANGCTVGFCSKVCPTGAITNDGRSVTFRGNRGPAGTGSNGNAGPISGGLPIDPAAETFKKQIQRYREFELRQQAAAERDIANQNRIQANIPQGNAGPA